MRRKDEMLNAIQKEIKERNDVRTDICETVYFGGGTPSILTIEELEVLFSVLHKKLNIAADAEITLEANPDDLKPDYVKALKSYTPVNRISVGIQALQEKHLKLMNRRHTGREAKRSIEILLSAGFSNLNIDLIYGIPGMTFAEWAENMNLLSYYPVPHLSAYHLSIEPRTVFSHYLKGGRIKPAEEEESLVQYNHLLDVTEEKGYDNYEISNFALADCHSRHNLGYWKGKAYVGYGPSAHSYNGHTRRWNISNNTLYIEKISKGENDYYETEKTSRIMAFNEYLLTGLRTKWGISEEYIIDTFGEKHFAGIRKKLRRFKDSELISEEEGHYYLSRKGKIISDFIIRELIIA